MHTYIRIAYTYIHRGHDNPEAFVEETATIVSKHVSSAPPGGDCSKHGGGSTGKAQNGSIPALSEDLQFIDSIVRKEVGRSAGQVCAHVPGAPPRTSPRISSRISMLSSTSAGRSAFFGNLVASFNRQDYPNKELLVITYIIYI